MAKQIKQRKPWNAEQENILISMWEERIEQLRGTRKNSHIFSEMAYEFKERGHCFSATEIKIKIHNLTNKYR